MDPPRSPLGRVRTGGAAHLAFLLAAAMVVPVAAGQEEAQKLPISSAPTVPCVIVEVGGTRSGDLECAAHRATQAARLNRAQAEAIRNLSVVRAGAPDVRVGVSSLPGTRLRMGGNLGVSVRPARPVVTPVNPMGSRP
jgi:hypothetical protein